MTNGKGSARRPGKPGAYERGYDAIRWKSKASKEDRDIVRAALTGGTATVGGKTYRAILIGDVLIPKARR